MFQDVYWKYFRDKCTVYIDIKRSYVLLKKVCCVNKKVCCVNKKNVLHRNYVTQQNYVVHKNLFCDNKKIYVSKERLMSTKYVNISYST